ncbi:hypothetical protein BBI01_17800 [Chryseobacterium artocarpi]|uniref:Bacterial EndoU nuclease domain-containing protein n=1 Tax=Chryseobacterium artocarpi TaxID=1414727 RepID=A0A1B8ZC08_9FLAO|nr:EndoU domain-containing protein [Chryseobacterium artocarpi]OCA69066.1 hypothetical protein BBI01_17800 [Chryseobacterium artocarpi]
MPYYIHKYLPSEHQDMLHGERIVEIEKAHPFESLNFEGPYNNLKDIKSDSTIYKNLLESNPRRAQKIFEEKFIVRVKNIIVFPDLKDNVFMGFIYKIMQHSLNGRISSDDVSGIHLISEKVKIIEVIKEELDLGIKKCIIEVFNERTGKWILKSEPTTFFPEHWDLQLLINECYFAFSTKIQINNYTFQGVTSQGITLEFIIKNGELRTVYPLIEHLN